MHQASHTVIVDNFWIINLIFCFIRVRFMDCLYFLVKELMSWPVIFLAFLAAARTGICYTGVNTSTDASNSPVVRFNLEGLMTDWALVHGSGHVPARKAGFEKWFF